MKTMEGRAFVALLGLACAATACDSFASSDAAPDASAPDAGPAADASSTNDAGTGDASTSDGAVAASRSVQYEALVKSLDPAAYWRFTEGGGTKATSIAGAPVALVVAANGPTWSDTGVFGAASRSLRFLATTTTAAAEATPVKQVGASDFAMEAWIEVALADTSERWLFHQTGPMTSYGIFVDTTGLTAHILFSDGSTETAKTGKLLGPGWHHVVISRTVKPMTLWVDSVSHVATDGMTGVQTFTPTFVAEVALYDRGLTATEVAEHDAAGRP
jgi:hypothetical protein